MNRIRRAQEKKEEEARRRKKKQEEGRRRKKKGEEGRRGNEERKKRAGSRGLVMPELEMGRLSLSYPRDQCRDII